MAKSSFDRRKFLKISALSTAQVALNGCASLDRYFIGDQRNLGHEVVILGAGAAGLAAAFELKRRNIPFRIFEASARVGGRVHSVSVFPEGGPVAELGAEFFEIQHSHVFGLAKELNLPVTPVPSASGLTTHSFSFNKKKYGVQEIVGRLRPLDPILQRIRADLFNGATATLSFENSLRYERSIYYDSLSLKDLLDSWSRELDPIIIKLIEIQAVTRFGVEAKDQSALHFLSTIEPGGTALLSGLPMYRMSGGLSNLTQTLAARISGVIPEQILKMNMALVKINEENDVFSLTFQRGMVKETFRARHIICTIPFSKLRQVEGVEKLNFSDAKKENIRTQAYATHSKGVLGFDKAFWRQKLGKRAGHLGNFTGDFLTQKFWDSARGQDGTHGLLTYQRAGNSGASAGAAAGEEALQDLSVFYPEANSLRPTALSFVNWAQRKWSEGSMAFYRPGQYMKYKGVAAKPEYEGRFVFAGEHTSLKNAGTLEGALESGHRAAVEMSLYLKSTEKITS